MTVNNATPERRHPAWHEILAAIETALTARVADLDAAFPPPPEAPTEAPAAAGVEPQALLAERLARLDESLARAENRTALALGLLDEAAQELADWHERAAGIVERAEADSGGPPPQCVAG